MSCWTGSGLFWERVQASAAAVSLKQKGGGGGQRRRLAEQGHDEVRLAREVKKVPRVRQHATVLEQVQHDVFFRLKRRRLHHAVPATVGAKRATGRRRRRECRELPIIRDDARLNLRSHWRSAPQQL